MSYFSIIGYALSDAVLDLDFILGSLQALNLAPGCSRRPIGYYPGERGVDGRPGRGRRRDLW